MCEFAGCPVCEGVEPETEMVICPECYGFPVSYFDENGDVILKDQWDELPELDRFTEVCEKCKGAGLINILIESE